jgi:hypothetical protein
MYREWLEGLIFLQWQYIFSCSDAFLCEQQAETRAKTELSKKSHNHTDFDTKVPRRPRKNIPASFSGMKKARHVVLWRFQSNAKG